MPREAASDRILLLRDHQAEWLPVVGGTAESVCTARLELPRSELGEYVLPDGGRLWIARAQLPALVEAERVRALEQSAVLRAVFGGAAGTGATRGLQMAQLFALVLVLMMVLTHHG